MLCDPNDLAATALSSDLQRDNRTVTLSLIWHWGLIASEWALAIGWFYQAAMWYYKIGSVPNLNSLKFIDLTDSTENLPQVTVVVPACNEESAIGATIRSLLSSTGIRLQVVAVDDRSTDETGLRMDQVASEVFNKNNENSIEIIHINTLPLRWLGKPHALSAGADAAKADWILFTDGDVLFAPEALARALQYAVSDEVDHLVVMPDWITGSNGEAAMHGAMHALTTWSMRLWRVNCQGTKDFIGIGAFNLVRRSAYERLGGFRALRMEVLEDLRLGWMIKRAGMRQRVVLGPGLVSVRWANGAWGVVRNLEKNLFALHRYSTALMLLSCAGLALQIGWPLLGLLTAGWALAGGVATYIAIAAVYAASRRVTRVPVGYVLVFPVAASLFLFAMVRSMTLALWRGGVVWRGTLYSLKDLRAHAGRFW